MLSLLHCHRHRLVESRVTLLYVVMISGSLRSVVLCGLTFAKLAHARVNSAATARPGDSKSFAILRGEAKHTSSM